MDYSPFNPIVWTLFLGFVATIWGVARIYSARHPDYPGKRPGKADDDPPRA